jgi:inositol-hexakisphosphate/diphosphoinositol-pentakisphosphate 1-kinase
MYVDDGSDGGLLRLHSTYRHDLKCYTSDEGRCQKTAAAFLKGMLTMDGALAPILAIMVNNDESARKMLDDSSSAAKLLDLIKVKLSDLIHYDPTLTGESLEDYYTRTFEEEPA